MLNNEMRGLFDRTTNNSPSLTEELKWHFMKTNNFKMSKNTMIILIFLWRRSLVIRWFIVMSRTLVG